MKWLMPVARGALPVVLQLAAAILASQLVLAGLPAECAEQLRDLVVRLYV